MKISINTGGLRVNFADMVKDVKLIYTNVGNIPFLVDFVDPAGETKTTTVLPGERYIISSNAGNPTGGRLTFSTESGQTYMVVSKVQEDSTVDGVDEKGYLAGTASKDEVDNLQEEITTLLDTVDEVSSSLSSVKTDVTALKTKTQNQSATSGNTSLTGNLTVNGTISTGSMSDIAGKVSQNQSAISGIQADVSTLALSKLPYGTLYFNNAKLFGSNFAIPNFPFSICATVRVDSWEGSTQGIQTIFQFGNNGTGASWGSIWFNNVKNNPGIVLRISKNTDGTLSYSEVSYPFNKDTFLGKEHTIIGVCRELESTPVNFDIYVDGAKVATSHYKGLTLDSLSGTVDYAVNTYNANYSAQPASAHPMMLRNLYVFNFDVSAGDAPYSIADYVAGRLIPPALKPSQVSLALENYTIARNSTTTLVKDASGNSNDATVQGSGTVAGDNDQSIKVFVDEIKTQINQANG
jgi:hypothetical protein